MKLFKWGKKVEKNNLSFKSYGTLLPEYIGWLNGGNNNVPISQAFLYYQSVSPFFHAVNKIATEIATIRPFVYDTKSETTIDDHPVLKVLNNPNSNSTYYEFTKRAITHLLIAGNMYLRVRAINENSPPLYIDVIDPRAVTLTQACSIDQYPWQYNITLTNDSESFLRLSPTDFRYLNNSKTQELCHIKDFCSTTDNLQGMPRTAPLFYDLEQFALASKYNLAVLTNGGRLSTVFINNDVDLSPEDIQKLQQEANNSLKGPNNNGRQLVLNGNWKIQEFGVSNKDMDFLKQKEHVSQNIYSIFEIPLPLVMSSTMTMGNYETAITTFYDNAVIPTISYFFQRLSKFLLKRYKNSENLEINYDRFDISALETRRIEQLDKRSKIGVESINELRVQMNLDQLKIGGDSIFKNSNEVPVGSTTPLLESNEYQRLISETHGILPDELKHFKDHNGNPLFNDDELKKLNAKNDL